MYNLHATGLVVADRGLLITGPSGSGKSALALSLVARAGAHGIFARFVSDDQIFLRSTGTRLLAFVPRPIAGLAEIRCLGPVPVSFEGAMVVDLIARLVPGNAAERLDPGEFERILGIRTPRLDVPERNIEAAAPAVLARLLMP